MATYRTTITTAAPANVAFDYLARFSSAVEWDPGVVRARDATPGPVEVGSAFELTVRTLGRDSLYRYEVTAIDRPRTVMVRAETGSFVSSDTIKVSTDGTSTEVTYEARLDTKGLARLMTPVLPFAFKRIGDRAAEGLQRELDRLGSAPAGAEDRPGESSEDRPT